MSTTSSYVLSLVLIIVVLALGLLIGYGYSTIDAKKACSDTCGDEGRRSEFVGLKCFCVDSDGNRKQPIGRDG